MALKQKIINVTFRIGKGQFGTSGSDTITLSNPDPTLPGPRVRTNITNVGSFDGSKLDMQIWGMTLSQMNQLSTLGINRTFAKWNSVLVEAGDSGQSLTTVFGGTITDGWFEGENAPDVSFHVYAQTGYLNSIKPISAVSFKGGVSIDTVLGKLAGQMTNDEGGLGVPYKNDSGVTFRFSDPYWTGSPLEQAAQVVAAAGADWNRLDDGTLTIWPPQLGRIGAEIQIDATSGMIGYPAMTSNGLILKTLFNPSIRLRSKISVGSILLGASSPGIVANVNFSTMAKDWWVISLTHDLHANLPGGKWESTIEASPYGTQATPSKT